MQISYINTTSLLLCFLPILIWYKSIKAFIILFIGLLFHTNRNNKKLLFIDVFTNILLISHTYYYCEKSRNVIYLGCILTLINFYLFYNNLIQLKYSDILHGVVSHMTGYYGLYLSYDKYI